MAESTLWILQIWFQEFNFTSVQDCNIIQSIEYDGIVPYRKVYQIPLLNM